MLKVLFSLLVILIIITVTKFLPLPIFSFINFTNLSDDEFANLLTALDLILAIILAIYKTLTDFNNEKKFYYTFSTYNKFLPLNSHQIVDTMNERLFHLNDSIINGEKTCCYRLKMVIDTCSTNSIYIPLLVKLNSNIDLNAITFSYVRVFLQSGKKAKKYYSEKRNFDIQVSENGNCLTIFDLFCNRANEKKLLNGRFLIFTKTIASNNYGKRIKKYVILDIQSVNGKCIIHNQFQYGNYFKYKLKMRMLK